jgi:hypothetical protein
MKLSTKKISESHEDAEIPFDNIVDRLTGFDPSVTDYVLEVLARCLNRGAAARFFGSSGFFSYVAASKTAEHENRNESM